MTNGLLGAALGISECLTSLNLSKLIGELVSTYEVNSVTTVTTIYSLDVFTL